MTGVVIKCCMIALVTSIVVIILKELRVEWSGLCGLLGGIIILIGTFAFLDQMLTLFASLISQSGLDKEHFRAIFKCMGITFFVDFISGFCKGQGQFSLATAIETAGRIGVCVIAIPFALDLLALANQIFSA